MKTFFKFFIIIVILLFAAGFFAWNMVPSWVTNKLSKEAGVTVSIGDIGATLDKISVRRFAMGNPPGRTLSRALGIQKAEIDAPLSRYLDDNIVIDRVEAKNIYIGVEFDRKGSSSGNWTTIMGNIKRNSLNSEETKKTVLIKKLRLRNIIIDLAYTNEPGKVKRLKPIDKISLNNVSSEGGIPSSVIMDIVIEQMLDEIFSIENLQNMIQGVIQGLDSNGRLSPLQGLFGEALHEK
ncbi:MAG: hypothetical protein SNF33_07935 [Candidatus Algichlamydia australiensis]|nr:hypothetical protein [Chlamydiales bacterium]